MLRRLVYSFLLAITVLVMGVTVHTSAQTFEDVPSSKEYYEAVEMLVEKGAISKGKYFNPNNNVTRGQLAKIMAIALQLDTKNVKNPGFKDVPTTHQFYPYIAALAQKGIISGYSDGTFGVNKQVTRNQMAKFIVNGFELKQSKPIRGIFKDHPLGEYDIPKDGYENAYTLWFYNITNAESYGFSKPVKRSQIAMFIQRAIEAKRLDAKSVRYKLTDIDISGNIGQYRHYFSKEGHPTVKVDAYSSELYFTAEQPGEFAYIASMATYMKERVKLKITVDDNLKMKLQEVDRFEKGFEVPFHYFAYGIDSNIKTVESTPLVVGTSKLDILHASDPKGYESYYYYSKNDGEVTKLDITYMNGKTETRYVHSFLYDSVIYNREMEFFEDRFEIDLNTLYKATLIQGDATGVQIVDNPEATSTYVDQKLIFTKPGLYVFDVSFTQYVFKIGEFDGKLFAAYEW